MNIRLLPTSRFGRWSAWLLVVFIVMRLVRTFLPDAIQLIPDVSWWMLVLWPNPLVFAVGWVSGVLAWVSIVRQRERALLTLFAAGVAVLITVLFGAILIG